MKRRIMQHFIRVFTYLSLLGKMDLQKKKYNFLEIIICDPSIYTIDHPDLTISNFMRNFIGTQKVNLFEPRHEISNNVVCATSKGSDQPAHTRSLIRAFANRVNILRLLGY